MEFSTKFQKAVEKVSNNPKYMGCVFNVSPIYFIVENGAVSTISDDASDSFKGGWFPDIIHGQTDEENSYIKKLMDKYDFDERFVLELVDEPDFEDLDEEYILGFYEGDEKKQELFLKLVKEFQKDNGPFQTLKDFVNGIDRYNLDENCLYYKWEGWWTDLYDNISDYGEEPGYYDDFEEEEWIDILKELDDYIVTA